jgi:hypothetical protein
VEKAKVMTDKKKKNIISDWRSSNVFARIKGGKTSKFLISS